MAGGLVVRSLGRWRSCFRSSFPLCVLRCIQCRCPYNARTICGSMHSSGQCRELWDGKVHTVNIRCRGGSVIVSRSARIVQVQT